MTEKFSELGDQMIERPDGYTGKLNLMKWHKFKVPVGGKYGPFFFNQIEARRTANKSIIMIVTGAPGEGKSYCALRLSQIFDPKFDVTLQVVFEREKFLYLVGNDSPLDRGQVIVIDEAQYVAGSRRWYEDVQKDLMEAIESVRSRGYIIIIVALHLDLMDIIIRKYVLSYMIHMEAPGNGVIYRLSTPRFSSKMYKKRQGRLMLSLPDQDVCEYDSCLICKHMDRCISIRAVYERNKHEFLGSRAKEVIEKVELEKLKKSEPPLTEMLDMLKEAKGEVYYTQQGRVDKAFILDVIRRRTGVILSENKQRTLRTLLEKELNPKLAENRKSEREMG